MRDTGHGIPAAVRERLFEPFFTTKPLGEGTGMGLAVAHGIVDAHGGTIAVESAPGDGAAFRITLPLDAGAPAAAPPTPPTSGGSSARSAAWSSAGGPASSSPACLRRGSPASPC